MPRRWACQQLLRIDVLSNMVGHHMYHHAALVSHCILRRWASHICFYIPVVRVHSTLRHFLAGAFTSILRIALRTGGEFRRHDKWSVFIPVSFQGTVTVGHAVRSALVFPLLCSGHRVVHMMGSMGSAPHKEHVNS